LAIRRKHKKLVIARKSLKLDKKRQLVIADKNQNMPRQYKASFRLRFRQVNRVCGLLNGFGVKLPQQLPQNSFGYGFLRQRI
jgi:hypothetical protein